MNSRGNAKLNEATNLKKDFSINRILVNPKQVRLVEIYNEDPIANPNAVVIASYTPTKESDGWFEIDVAVNILSNTGKWYDKWYFTWEDGETETSAVESFFVFEEISDEFYTTKAKVVEGLDDVSTANISDTWMQWADAYIDEICTRDFRTHNNEIQTEYVEEYNTDYIILLENYPVLAINSIYKDDDLLDTIYYVWKEWGKIHFGLDGNDIAFSQDEKVVIDYNFGYSTIPKLVEEIATMIVQNYYKAKQTNKSSGNSNLITTSKKFVNYSVNYQMINNDFLKKDSELFDKIQLLKRQYQK